MRDWQNFDMDWDEAVEEAQQAFSHPRDSEEGRAEQHAAEAEVYGKLRKEMSSYLESVIRTRKAEDLQVLDCSALLYYILRSCTVKYNRMCVVLIIVSL